MDDEHELLMRAHRFDETALAAIFDRYYGMIARYTYLHTGHAQTAEDLAAQVFHRLLDALRAGHGPERALKAWLFRVASNLIIDEVRRGKHRDHEPLEESLHTVETVENAAAYAMQLADLRAALAQLTDSQRSIIVLRYLMEMSNEETAHILGMTVGAVKAQQVRALAALRRTLNKEASRESST
ncbi:MAG: sigma-70 family RNA polymerase sigma factor [Anaerolineae bacterium]